MEVKIMTKIEQMDELIKKFQEDVELQKEVAVVLQTEDPEDTAKADQWLADNDYEFTLRELVEHLEDGVPLSDEQLEAVAGGKSEAGVESSKNHAIEGALGIGIGIIIGGIQCIVNISE